MRSERVHTFRRRILCCSRPTSSEPLEPARPATKSRPASRTSHSPIVPKTNVSRTTLSANPSKSDSALPLLDPVPSLHPEEQSARPTTQDGNEISRLRVDSSMTPSVNTGNGGPSPNLTPVMQAGSAVAAVPTLQDPKDDIFREALERHKQKLSHVQQQAFHGASAVGLIDIIKEFNNQHSEESISRKSAMKVQTLLQATDGYLGTLGMFAQFNQFGPPVAGSLKLFVDIGLRYTGFFDKLNETMETLSSHLNYLSWYGKLYNHYPEVKNALCDAYGDLIIFCKTTCEIFMNKDGKLSNKISATVLLKQLSNPLDDSLGAINAKFNEHITRIEKTANILECERKLLKESLQAREEADRKRGKVLSWLSKLEPEDDFERIYAKRYAGTGMWLEESEQLREWRQARKHCLLWCHGLAGVGKSVLASILVEKIASDYPFDERVGIGFFYFSFQSENQTPAAVLSILIKQLCRRKKELPVSLQDLYRQCISNDKAPKPSELQTVFQAIVGTYEEVFLVVDAMDECKEENRKQLLPYILSLFELGSGRLKIFVTSRPERDIELVLTSKKIQVIKIEAKKVDEDIKTYVHNELANRPHDYCDLDPDLCEKIERALVSKAQGMFLWVRCQLDEIYRQPSKVQIEDTLKKLPVDMTETYQRILKRIRTQQSQAMVTIAERALTWVITAKRPLSPLELATAVAIEPTSNSAKELKKIYKPEVVIIACCGLLTSEDDSVRPIHFSVKEFLGGVGTGIPNEEEANAELARSSIQYMLCREFVSNNCFYIASRNGYMQWSLDSEVSYIFGFWEQHIRGVQLPLPDELAGLFKKFLNSGNCHSAYLCRVQGAPDKCSTLSMCATFDLLPIYHQFHPLDGSVTSPSEIKNAIQDAARGGSVSAMDKLLGLIDEGDRRSDYALYLAAEAGRVGAAQLLIKHGAIVNIGEGANALEAAAKEGHINIVELLLANGADVNIQGGKYGNALQAAACEGKTTIVELLLANGADVNIQGGYFGNALQAAACKGETTTVKLLLTNGTDVNIQGGYFGNALQAAAYGSETTTVELLLANGADVNIQGGEYGNALQAAVCGGKTTTVELLLANGADVNIQGGEYGNALQAAVAMGRTAIIELLLVNGADTNTHGGNA